MSEWFMMNAGDFLVLEDGKIRIHARCEEGYECPECRIKDAASVVEGDLHLKTSRACVDGTCRHLVKP